MEDHAKEIEKIIDDLQCPKNFKCSRLGLERLCKAKDIGLETHIECLEEDSLECQFSVAFGGLYYCHCPLRIYIAKKLKK
jgi:hypothetical protein